MAIPLTAFEQRGRVAPWTTLAEAETFLDALILEAPHISREVVGSSVQGNPMELFTIGTGPTKVLWTAQQHGSELSGREAIFTKLREWAETTDPDLLSYFSNVTLLLMPTCHPDNLATRENVNGINLNRDHVRLTQPETQAIHAVIRDHQPDLIVDWHEGANITANYASAPAFNANADPEILALSNSLSSAVRAAVEGESYTWELYQGPTDTMKGPENFHNNAAVRGTVSVLLETRRVYGNDSDAALRHNLQLIAADEVIAWHAANLADVATTVQDARNDASSRTEPIVLLTGTSASGPATAPGIVEYLLNGAGHEALALHRNRFGLVSSFMDGYYRYPLGQEQRILLAYLVDPQSSQRVATAVTPVPASIEAESYRLGVDDKTMTLAGVKVGVAGQTLTVWP